MEVGLARGPQGPSVLPWAGLLLSWDPALQ